MKRRLLVAGSLSVLLGGAGVWMLRDGEYATVVSIRSQAEFQDPALLAKIESLPVAASFLQHGFEYQRNPSFCGPTSAVDVLRSLGVSVDSSSILTGTGLSTWFGLLPAGANLDQLAAVLRHHGRKVTVLRDLDLDGFRALMATANDPRRRFILNFHRGPLFGKGGGHHSPVGGYLADRDLVLVLDVNESYRPWLVPTARLFAAVHTVDGQTGLPRGVLQIE